MKLKFAATMFAMIFSMPCSASEQTVLKITGNISKSNASEGEYVFGIQELKRLPVTTVTTKTPWTSSASYQGVLVRDILKYVGANKDSKYVSVNSLDNYRVSIPVSDFWKWRVLLAYKKNGQFIPLSDKGPLWLIYPISESPDADSNATATKMVWALTTIKVK